MKMFLTRLGFGARMIVTGRRHPDRLASRTAFGAGSTCATCWAASAISPFVYFDSQDVVRHKLVQDIVSAYKPMESSTFRRADRLRTDRRNGVEAAGGTPRRPTEARHRLWRSYRLLLRERLAGFGDGSRAGAVGALNWYSSPAWWSSHRPHRLRLPSALRDSSSVSPAPRTVVADRAVTVLDVQATEELRAEVAKLVEPVYVADPAALGKATASSPRFLQEAKSLRGQLNGTLTLDQALLELEDLAPETVSAAAREFLLKADSSTFDLVQNQALGALKTVNASRSPTARSKRRDSIFGPSPIR